MRLGLGLWYRVIYTVSQKTHQLLNGVARFWWHLAEIFKILQFTCTTPNTYHVQPRTTLNRLHVRSAMYLSDQPSWWCRPVTHVQLAGHLSTTDIWCRGTPPTRAAATSVLTQLLKSQLGFWAVSSVSFVRQSPLWNSAVFQIYRRFERAVCGVHQMITLQPLMIIADDGMHLYFT